MDNKEKRINIEEELNALSPEELKEIAGGRIKAPGYAALVAAVLLFKKKGFSKEYAIQELANGWNKGSPFRYDLTDNTDQDFDDMIKFIDSIW